MGPSLIYDKSAIQSFLPEEALWLHLFYNTNLTPILLIETLADLAKEMKGGRTAKDVVGSLAAKTLILGDRINVHHDSIGPSELLGYEVSMDGRPLIAGGQSVREGGRTGLMFRESPEAEAINRWRRREFLEVEKLFASRWRKNLAALDLSAKRLRGTVRPRTLSEVREQAEQVHNRDGFRFESVRKAIDRFRLTERARALVIKRWKGLGAPRLCEFAPYAAHVLTVDQFFSLALGADLISDKRPSNHIDVAYLYYLPFCQIFTSGDDLHEKVVPLFLTKNQVFLKSADLKRDLAALNEVFAGLPEEVRSEGAMKFARRPPVSGDFLISRLWDYFYSPDWRKEDAKPARVIGTNEQATLRGLVEKIKSAPAMGGVTPVDQESADVMVFETRVPVAVGRWRLFPPDVKPDEE